MKFKKKKLIKIGWVGEMNKLDDDDDDDEDGSWVDDHSCINEIVLS